MPPVAPENDSGNIPPAVLLCLQVIKTRPDFLKAARARRAMATSLILQGRDRKDDSAAIRYGITCSKKVGNAVARNRAKRRLREAARAVLPANGCPGWDYVLIGKADITASRPFDLLIADLERAVDRVHTVREKSTS